jgi:hypothetical protein
MFFSQLLIIDFVNNVHEPPHDEINGGVFILHVFAYFGLLHILNKINIIAYFD